MGGSAAGCTQLGLPHRLVPADRAMATIDRAIILIGWAMAAVDWAMAAGG
jgi:hypothetical protein